MKNINNDIKILIAASILFFFTSLIEFLPWWSFALVAFLLGLFASLLNLNIKSFLVGFLSGFLIWFGFNFYFDVISNGLLLTKISFMLNLPKIVLLLFSGLIGGVLSGLSLYAGYTFFLADKNKVYNN